MMSNLRLNKGSMFNKPNSDKPNSDLSIQRIGMQLEMLVCLPSESLVSIGSGLVDDEGAETSSSMKHRPAKNRMRGALCSILGGATYD